MTIILKENGRDAGCWLLDTGYWLKVKGYRMSGVWILDTGYWMQVVCWSRVTGH